MKIKRPPPKAIVRFLVKEEADGKPSKRAVKQQFKEDPLPPDTKIKITSKRKAANAIVVDELPVTINITSQDVNKG